MPVPLNKSTGLEARKFWDQKTSVSEPKASFDVFPKIEYCRCSPEGTGARVA
jgi:hypothetical protein